MDFTHMDGYQFEDYIAALLVQKGFYVEKTNYSNDGGIDLIAYFDAPLFKGKYIIQCKNWTELVGQPEIRDLYGVVMDQRANKGILITPSDFTMQAYEFAEGKNIELINGNILNQLIIETKEITPSKHIIRKTYEGDRFDYLKNKIASDVKSPENYLELIKYLKTFAYNADSTKCCGEVFDEIIDWTTKMINKCFKTESKRNDKNNAMIIMAEAYLMSGRISEATEILLTIGNFWINSLYPEDGITIIQGDSEGYYYSKLLSWNLLTAYKFIGFDRGVDALLGSIMYTDGPLSQLYHEQIFGSKFFYISASMETQYRKKSKYLNTRLFFPKENYAPEFYFDTFYGKSKSDYLDELNRLWEVHGLE